VNYHTVSVDRTVEEDGVYLLAVYAPRNASGPVGVTIGYEEEFSPTEYLTVPFDLVRIHSGKASIHSSSPVPGSSRLSVVPHCFAFDNAMAGHVQSFATG